MKSFEYVTILFSILLGVCITQMATNIVFVIQNFNTAIIYPPAILWNAAALLAILAHWVHFHKARNREKWNAFQITIVFITPLVYFIPATLLSRAPNINGHLNYEVLFDDNKTLIYTMVILFVAFTMIEYYFLYDIRKKIVYAYYSAALVLVVAAFILDSKTFDLVLSVGIFCSEIVNHYMIHPMRLE